MKKKIIFTAGGTGGHIFPALAVAKLCADEYDVLWIGAIGGIENTIIPKYDIPICSVNISGLRNKGLLRLVLMPFLLFRAFIQIFIIILRERPDVIAGFGGYATFPVCFMGVVLRIPVVIHEQNSVAGLTNRILSKLVNKVMIAFSGVLPSKKTLLVGNPVREDIANLKAPELRYLERSGGLNLLVLGGSLGAKVFNDNLAEVFSLINQQNSNHIASIIHQVGRGDRDLVVARYKEHGINNVTVVNFIDDMASVYANTDLLICRAGASTVSEVCHAGIAAIFIPYPHAVDDHQYYNAKSLVDNLAALMVPQSQFSSHRLADIISKLDRRKCMELGIKAKNLALTDSATQIKQVITDFIIEDK